MELFSLYMVYEYTGQIKPLAQLFETDDSITSFVKELSNFYYRERLALLYCAQVILNGANTDCSYCVSWRNKLTISNTYA